MEYEHDKEKFPIVEVDGFVEAGKQFDIEINLPEDNRRVIFGIIKDSHKEYVKDAVVKLVEVATDKYGKRRLPVAHTFTNEYGEFVFGPLCADKEYSIDVWAGKVKATKVCAKVDKKGKCLKAIKLDPCNKFIDEKLCDNEMPLKKF